MVIALFTADAITDAYALPTPEIWSFLAQELWDCARRSLWFSGNCSAWLHLEEQEERTACASGASKPKPLLCSGIIFPFLLQGLGFSSHTHLPPLILDGSYPPLCSCLVTT